VLALCLPEASAVALIPEASAKKKEASHVRHVLLSGTDCAAADCAAAADTSGMLQRCVDGRLMSDGEGIVPFPTHAQHTTTSRGAATVDAGGSEPSHSMSRASVLHEEIPRREAAVGGLAPVC